MPSNVDRVAELFAERLKVLVKRCADRSDPTIDKDLAKSEGAVAAALYRRLVADREFAATLSDWVTKISNSTFQAGMHKTIGLEREAHEHTLSSIGLVSTLLSLWEQAATEARQEVQ